MKVNVQMSKAIKQTLAAIGPRQAVLIGKEAPANTPRGAILLQFGKSYALQREASNIVEALPGKIPAAVKALVESGGIVSAKVAKAAGLDFAALLTRMENNKTVTVNATATKFTVTPRAKRADLISGVGEAPKAKPAKGAKVVKEAPAPKGGKKAVKAAEKPAKAPKGGKGVAARLKRPLLRPPRALRAR